MQNHVPKSLTINNNEIVDKVVIANYFNNYFANTPVQLTMKVCTN